MTTSSEPEDAPAIDAQLFAAAESGDAPLLAALLDQHPERLEARNEPYAHTLLHVAAFHGHLDSVNLLLDRGLDPNVKERGDRTYPMHWAAAAGHLAIVRRLADAGGDVIGHGDDHGLEVIGWATFWDNAHRDVADFLVSRGARHHIFSALALDDAEEVRRVVTTNPAALSSRMTRNENHQTPLHFAVARGNRRMVELLMELGADPLSVDGENNPVSAYAVNAQADLPVMEAIRRLTLAELDSAERGRRQANLRSVDLVAALALEDWTLADQLLLQRPDLMNGDALHLMARRGATSAARWLIDRGADVNALRPHWGADVTPLHLAIWHDHAEMVRLLLDRDADPGIKDTRYDGDAVDWADHFERPALRALLTAPSNRPRSPRPQ